MADAVDVLKRELNGLSVGNLNTTHTSSLNLQRHPPEGHLRAASCRCCFHGCNSLKSTVALKALLQEVKREEV